jgi:hypothetical protein
VNKRYIIGAGIGFAYGAWLVSRTNKASGAALTNWRPFTLAAAGALVAYLTK